MCLLVWFSFSNRRQDIDVKLVFNTKFKEHPDQPKNIENEELQMILDENPYETKDEFVKSLGVDR